MQTLKPAKIAMYAKIQAKKGQMLSWQFVNIWDGSHTGLQYLTFQAGLPPVKKKKKKKKILNPSVCQHSWRLSLTIEK